MDRAIWWVIQVLVVVTVVGFAGAAWGLYTATAWWRPVHLRDGPRLRG